MKLIYCTSIAFSNKLANLVQVRAMAKEFQKQLGEDFYLGVNYKNVEDDGIKILSLNSKKSYILAWRYLKLIKEKGIDYIYCREARLIFFIIIFNKLFFRRKISIAYEVHAMPLGGVLSRLVEKSLGRSVNKFIFVTEKLRDIYSRRYGCLRKNTLVSPDAVDLSIFNINLSKHEAREKLGLPKDKQIVGYMGRFKTMGMDKGISTILKALRFLSDDVLFVAVGGNKKDLPEYEVEAERLGVSKKMKLFGNVEQDTLAIYQKACDLLLMPFPYNEHYAYYMSPLKMFEYMASQRPIIATDLPSIREVLNSQNALIIKPDSPEDLAKGMMMLTDQDLSQKISSQAFVDVAKYTWQRRVSVILEFMEK